MSICLSLAIYIYIYVYTHTLIDVQYIYIYIYCIVLCINLRIGLSRFTSAGLKNQVQTKHTDNNETTITLNKTGSNH